MSRVGQSILSSNVKSDACQSSLKCSVSWLCHKSLLKYPSQNAIIFGLFLPFILPQLLITWLVWWWLWFSRKTWRIFYSSNQTPNPETTNPEIFPNGLSWSYKKTTNLVSGLGVSSDGNKYYSFFVKKSTSFPNYSSLAALSRSYPKTNFLKNFWIHSFRIGRLIWWRKYCSCFVRKSKSFPY